MDTSIFDQVASSLTVKSICSPFLGPDLEASQLLEHLEPLDPGSYPNFDPLNDAFRVIDSNGRPVGTLLLGDIVAFEDEGEDEEFEEPPTVRDAMKRVDFSHLLSSSTTILDA